MGQTQARLLLDAILHPLNHSVESQPEAKRQYTVGEFIIKTYLPYCERKWKESTALTSKQRIKSHLVGGLGSASIGAISREHLQSFLEEKAAAGLSASVVGHLRWDLRAMFQLAIEDGIIDRNPATSLVTPSQAHCGTKSVMDRQQVRELLSLFEVRERLILRLAIFAGLRPGEIFGLKWQHVEGEGVVIAQRVYLGKVGTPKTRRSVRTAALSPTTAADLEEWKALCPDTSSEAWVFPSERLVTPLLKDNWWRRYLEPQLTKCGLSWVTFQVMRRTHASLSRKAQIDPKIVADQLGHGLGVNLDVYTKSDLKQRAEAVRLLESDVLGA